MKFDNEIKKYTLTTGDLNFNLLESGDISTIEYGNTQINLLQGNSIEGSCSNLYLRIFDQNEIYYTKMIGIDSPSKFYIENNQAFYKGTFKSVTYEVVLSLIDNIWFWDVLLTNINNNNQFVDVIYGQDIAIADIYAVRNNEAYVCQYIDHKVFQTENGYTVCTRQNQGTPHYLQQGSLTKNVAYSTDGFQFFGLEYKFTNIPKVLKMQSLENRNYQYEFAFTALQSEKVDFNEQKRFVFYGLYEDNIVEVADSIRYEIKINDAYNKVCNSINNFDENNGKRVIRKLSFNQLLESIPFTNQELNNLYPLKKHIEKEGETLLSFFTNDSSYVVLKEKELLVERPHGNMLLTGNNLFIKENIISSTNYIFGVFNSHIVVGNTNFNKFTTNIRNPLNCRKISGQRIFIEIDGKYKCLGIPSIYEAGLNYSKWIYKINNDILVVSSMVLVDSPQLILDVKSTSGVKYNFIVTNHIILGPNENEHPFEVKIEQNNLEFSPNENSMCHEKYPNLKYNMIISESYKLNNDSIFFEDNKKRNEPLLNLSLQEIDSFRIITIGRIKGETYDSLDYKLEIVKADYLKYLKNNINQFNLTIDNEVFKEVDKFNDISLWYSHNALIHYTAPHGLEQYNGAAWGTRDVCQGPVEYFLSIQRFDVVRDILLKIYSHQFKQNGDWPQWFMFDGYVKIQAHESHGDIIVWPLRTLALYLLSTADYSILDELVFYTDIEKSEFTNEKDTVLNHVLYQINVIKNNFIPKTHLSCYGGGDWDDTLQPANKELTKSMVSGWTVALTFEALTLFSQSIKTYQKEISDNLEQLANAIKQDFNDFVIKDHVPAGFLLFDKDEIKYMLHPRDNESNIKYRLLPLNRGIIGELFTSEQTEDYCKIIDQYLKYPDGIRLMDAPVKYNGGINTFFTRAETASNFGREIGLQYVHASIRYIEAMAKIGKFEEVWKYLLILNPINIQDAVPNALRRQSNLYFSSSDANFYDRYEATRDFNKLKNGEISVKGGWRIYSSGPGIYLNQLITNVLGVKVVNNDLVLDPILPKKLDGLKFTYQFFGKPIEITYHISSENNEKSKIIVNGEEIILSILDNKYRQGGALIKQSYLKDFKNTIEIYM